MGRRDSQRLRVFAETGNTGRGILRRSLVLGGRRAHMERPLNPVWQQCLAAVEPVLDSFGFKLCRESQLYSLMGSASADYERSDMRIELFWDGKENWVDALDATRNRNERHLWGERQRLAVGPPPSNIRAHVLRPGQIADEYIVNLIAAVRRIAGP